MSRIARNLFWFVAIICIMIVAAGVLISLPRSATGG